MPDSVHYVWIGESDFKLHHYLSIRSADRYLNPGKITLHVKTKEFRDFGANFSPRGKRLWRRVEHLPNFSLRQLDIATGIFKKNAENLRFQSLYARLKILRAFGGIALDNDVICLKSFKKLLHYEFVIGRESYGLNPAIILASMDSAFLGALVQAIHAESDSDVDNLLWRLSIQMSHQIHIEDKSFRRHDYDRQKSLYRDQVDELLADNYALKLYQNLQRKEFTFEELKSHDSTFGRVARMILFGEAGRDLQATDWQLTTEDSDSEYVVPNIIHYVWFTCHEFKFHHFLGVKSVIHNQKPDRILFHTDCQPSGALWEEVRLLAGPMLEIVDTTMPLQVYGRRLGGRHPISHASDVARAQVLLDYGGIYMDSDTVILKSLNPLRVYNCTMGMEIAGLNTGLSLSRKNDTFMQIFQKSYQFYDSEQWNWNAVMEPYRLAAENPDLVHIETTGLTRPHWTDWWDMNRVWRQSGKMDWSHSYGIHWIYSYHKTEYNPLEIRCIDSNFGEIARHIFYGSKELMEC